MTNVSDILSILRSRRYIQILPLKPTKPTLFCHSTLAFVASLLLVQASCSAGEEGEKAPPAPEVTIQSPIEGASFRSGEEISLSYEANNMATEEGQAERNIIIYLNGQKLPVGNGGELPNTLPPGEYILEIKLEDGTLLARVTFTVEAETEEPVTPIEEGAVELPFHTINTRIGGFWIGDSVTAVIRTEQEWLKFRNDYDGYYTGTGTRSGTIPTPPVDFKDKMIVAVIQGGSGCEWLGEELIERIYRQKGVIYVHWKEDQLIGPCDAVIHTWQFVQIDKSALPVHFTKEGAVELPFHTVNTGMDGFWTGHSVTAVIRTEQEWLKFRNDYYTGTGTRSGIIPTPPVDFKDKMIVAVLQGGSGCEWLGEELIERIYRQRGVIYVHWKEDQLIGDCAAFISTWQFVQIDKSTLPVRFIDEEKSHPPVIGRQELPVKAYQVGLCSIRWNGIAEAKEEEALYGNGRAGGDRDITVIKHKETWQTVWQNSGCRHYQQGLSPEGISSSSPPEVDFTNKMIVMLHTLPVTLCVPLYRFEGKLYSESQRLYLSIDYIQPEHCDVTAGGPFTAVYEVDKSNYPLFRGEPLCNGSPDLTDCSIYY